MRMAVPHEQKRRLAISGGQLHDSQMMHAFLDWQPPPLAIVADTAYGSNKIRQQVADEGALSVVPAKSNARHPVTHDKNLYAMRNIVERFFCKYKTCAGFQHALEKYAQNSMAMLHLFAIKWRMD